VRDDRRVPRAAHSFVREFDAAPAQTFCVEQHYLLCVSRGALRMEVDGTVWMLPPRRAALIRAGQPVEVTIPQPVTSSSVLVSPSFAPPTPAVLSVFEETRRFTQAALYLLESDGNGFELVGHFGSRPVDRLDAAARRPFLLRLVSTRQPVTLEQLEREHDLLTGRRGAVADLESLDAIARTRVELVM
jgi:hypothetical protein